MQSPTPLEVAIIGAGMIAALHRRAAILAGGELIGVLASSPGRSRDVADDWGVRAFDDVAALLDSNVDVVHIATPNATHSPYGLAVIAALVLRLGHRRDIYRDR